MFLIPNPKVFVPLLFPASVLMSIVLMSNLRVDFYRLHVQPQGFYILPPTSGLILFCTSNLRVDAYLFNLNLRVDNMFFPALELLFLIPASNLGVNVHHLFPTSELTFTVLIPTLELMSNHIAECLLFF